MTNNLYVRVAQHKSGEIEGFSSDYQCNRLVYWESFDDVLKAINREAAEMAFAGQSITAR